MSLYKYVHEDRIDILKYGLIRFTFPSAFNDPFEMQPVISAVSTPDSMELAFQNGWEQLLWEQYQDPFNLIKNLISFNQFKQYAKSKKSEVVGVGRKLAQDNDFAKTLTETVNSRFSSFFLQPVCSIGL